MGRNVNHTVQCCHHTLQVKLSSLSLSRFQSPPSHQHGQTQAPVCPGSAVQHRPLSYRGQANSSNTAGALHGRGQRRLLERTFFVVFTLLIHKHSQDLERVECCKIALLSNLCWAQIQLQTNLKKKKRKMLKIQHNDVAQQGRHSL